MPCDEDVIFCPFRYPIKVIELTEAFSSVERSLAVIVAYAIFFRLIAFMFVRYRIKNKHWYWIKIALINLNLITFFNICVTSHVYLSNCFVNVNEWYFKFLELEMFFSKLESQLLYVRLHHDLFSLRHNYSLGDFILQTQTFSQGMCTFIMHL